MRRISVVEELASNQTTTESIMPLLAQPTENQRSSFSLCSRSAIVRRRASLKTVRASSNGNSNWNCSPPTSPCYGKLVSASHQHLLHHVPRHIRQPEIPSHVVVRQPRVLQPEAMQDRRLQIVHVNLVLHHVHAQIVRLADH